MKQKTLSAERREQIKRKIAVDGRVLTQDLCNVFNTTPVTIRKDLDFLENKGVLTKVHGGGILNQSIGDELSISEKEKINLREKERIAKRAESLINDGDAIILDYGVTAIHIARRLKYRTGITIITGGLNVANEIARSDNELILTGGVFNKNTFGLSGSLSENVIINTVVDKLFLGVDGVDIVRGLTAYNYEEAKLNRLMIKAAKEKILIADSSKFGKITVGYIGELKEIDRIITDKKLDNKFVEDINRLNIKLDLV